MTIAHIDEHGAASALATAKTAERARSVVAAPGGSAYVADSMGGKILLVNPPD